MKNEGEKMNIRYYPPQYSEPKFNCPYCQVYAQQSWHTLFLFNNAKVPNLELTYCGHCKKYSIWHEEVLIVPNNSIAPLAHEDLSKDIEADYNEARSIVNISPRGAAALLRLCIQKLMKELGETGKNINSDIGTLVKKGLPEEVQQALDILRVVGNESVHPGELDIRDDSETAIQLFELINFIVEDRITRKKKITTLFNKLPENKRREIDNRDNKSEIG